MGEDMKTLTIRLPAKMHEATQEAVKKRGYSGVAELVRDVLRRYLIEEGFLNGGDEK